MCLQPTMKHGGGFVQVYGYISAARVCDLVRIEGTINADKYKQILIYHGIPSGRRIIGNNYVLQHNNDPKHTATIIKIHLQRKAVRKSTPIRMASSKS